MPKEKYEKKPESVRNGYFEVPIRVPESDSIGTGYVSISKASNLAKYGPAYKLRELQELVRETIRDPDAIFGYNDTEWSGYCYQCACTYRCTNHGGRSPPPRGMTYLVFVTKRLEVIEWGWENCDELGNPIGRQDKIR